MESYEFLKDLAILLLVAKAFGIVAKKLSAPQVVGEILAGLILGPAVFGFLKNTDFIEYMAELGVIMLMFEAGLGSNLKQLKKTGAKASAIALAGVLIPMVLGVVLYMSVFGWAEPGTDEFFRALFIGVIMTATSVSITVAALKELGKVSDETGTTIVSAAIIDDVLGIIVLTLVLGMKDTSVNPGIIIMKAFLFFVVAIVSGILVYRVFTLLDEKYPHMRRVPIASLCYCLLMAFVAEEYFGIADITGAYVAGLVLCNLKDAEYIERKIDISSYMFFAPIFFAGIGLKTTFSSMDESLLLFSILFVIVAMLGKIIGCGGMAALLRFDRHESLKIGVGMMTRGEVALIVATKGLQLGVITSDYFTPVILLILITSVITPVALKALYRKTDKKAQDTAKV